MANVLANIFGSSPVMPLEKHIDIAYRCARELRPFFVATIASDWEAASAARDSIEALEHEADDLKKEIRLHLPKSLFMPVPREDLLGLLLVQDKIANRSKDVSGIVLGRKMQIPQKISEQFLDFVDRNIDAAKQARKGVRELDELFTAGFRGAEVDLVSGMIEELDRIETDTDEKQASLRAALFAIEDTLNPIDAVFMYQVIDLIGQVADMSERVGRRLELLLSHQNHNYNNNRATRARIGDPKWMPASCTSRLPRCSASSWRGVSARTMSRTRWRRRSARGR